MFFIIYAPLQFFLLYRLGPFAQVSVADDFSDGSDEQKVQNEEGNQEIRQLKKHGDV